MQIKVYGAQRQALFQDVLGPFEDFIADSAHYFLAHYLLRIQTKAIDSPRRFDRAEETALGAQKIPNPSPSARGC